VDPAARKTEDEMKKAIVLLTALLGLAVAGCDKEPSLGEALDDVYSTAPDSCVQYCNDLVECEWPNEGTVGGTAAEALKSDTKDQCVVDCGYKAGNGVFVFEQNWTEETGATYDVKASLEGAVWADYMTCLVEAVLFTCVEPDEDHPHWDYQIADGTTAACAAYDVCVQLLNINLEYNWNPEALEGAGECQPSGDEFIWGEY
jgi:hypothetical protein